MQPKTLFEWFHAGLISPKIPKDLLQNLTGKLGQQSAICWNSIGLFRDYGLNSIIFRNKTFFVFQDRMLKLSASVWKRISWNLTKFQLIQVIQTIVITIFSISCLIELKFCEVSRFFFQADAKSFSVLSWKIKSFILKKYIF